MKIGFDAKRLFLNKTGLGNYARTLVRNLQELYPEHHYYLYTPRVVRNSDTEYFISDRFIIRECKALIPSYWRRRGMVTDLLEDGIDLYHGLSHEIPWGIEKTGIKTCVTVHDLIFEVYPSLFKFIDRKMYHVKYKSSAERADRVLAISHSTANDIQSLWSISSDKIDVLYQSAGTDFFHIDNPESRKTSYLLYVGSVIERKGLLNIIKAYGLLKQRDFLPPLKIIGTGKAYLDLCKAEIRKQGMESWFQFVGEVENASLIDYYDESIGLIYPSVYEGFGIPIIEAMLRKVPVICSEVSSMPEAGGPYSIYISPRNIQSLADAIEHCLDYPEEMAIQAEKSYLYARENFNAQETAHSLLSIYRKLIK